MLENYLLRSTYHWFVSWGAFKKWPSTKQKKIWWWYRCGKVCDKDWWSGLLVIEHQVVNMCTIFQRRAQRWQSTMPTMAIIVTLEHHNDNDGNVGTLQWQRWLATMAMKAMTATMLMASESWCPSKSNKWYNFPFNQFLMVATKRPIEMINFSNNVCK